MFNLFSELVTMRSARKKYAQTTGLNLNQRFDLSVSYEITRSFVFGTLFIIFLQVFQAIFSTLIVFKVINLSEFMISLLTLIVLLEFSFFPWIILITNQRWRKRVVSLFRRRSNTVHVMDLKGQNILKNPTQMDYFKQLDAAWNA
ncbi:unnamed protein product [Caenorhabditis angaria]|uniref:Uncharacterized protein n=1 Tax=Caenorhabditis angaria TaxID=860376 RepID=A0A9P1ISU5_9PELO|nr:unnamed protein product [Caenorhabditis angaria]